MMDTEGMNLSSNSRTSPLTAISLIDSIPIIEYIVDTYPWFVPGLHIRLTPHAKSALLAIYGVYPGSCCC
jgi:hypothetical protein